MSKKELFKKELNKRLSDWAIEVGEQIEKKAKKEKWDESDYTGAINFMLLDIQDDVMELFEKYSK